MIQDSQLQDVFSNYTGKHEELIPILQDVQNSVGYVPIEAMSGIARFLNMPKSTIYGVATFYSQFYLSRQGRHKVRVCLGTACHVRGAGEIMKAVETKLGIKPGQCTPDFEFTVEKVACFGSCALAPVIVVDDTVYGNMTPDKAVAVLEDIQ